MSALPPIATAKANFRKRSCPLYPRKRIRFGPDIAGATIMTIKSAGMTIGEIRGRSKPTHEKQDDDDDQDDANDTYATMTEAVAVATEAATEATKQENDEDDNENES
jgi:hypothetical protein